MKQSQPKKKSRRNFYIMKQITPENWQPIMQTQSCGGYSYQVPLKMTNAVARKLLCVFRREEPGNTFKMQQVIR